MTKGGNERIDFEESLDKQQTLYFLPLPHGQGAFRAVCELIAVLKRY